MDNGGGPQTRGNLDEQIAGPSGAVKLGVQSPPERGSDRCPGAWGAPGHLAYSFSVVLPYLTQGWLVVTNRSMNQTSVPHPGFASKPSK